MPTNIHFWSSYKVTKLVKDVNCQFTFGVFTKWDECKKKAEEENEGADISVKQAGEDSEQEFREALENKCKVFFVDVKRVESNDVSVSL